MTLPAKLRLDTTTWLGDLVRDGGQFEVDDGLETAVLISLFTDRRAEADDTLPDGGSDRGGWWGDDYADVAGSRIGSRLWLLRRSKATQSVVQAAKRYAEEALAWMVEDGVAKSVTVIAERVQSAVLGIQVQITRTGDRAAKYNRLWEVYLDGI